MASLYGQSIFEGMFPVYYRVLLGDDKTPHVVTMQSFDEIHYDETCWLTDERFATKEAAQAYVDNLLSVARTLLGQHDG